MHVCVRVGVLCFGFLVGWFIDSWNSSRWCEWDSSRYLLPNGLDLCKTHNINTNTNTRLYKKCTITNAQKNKISMSTNQFHSTLSFICWHRTHVWCDSFILKSLRQWINMSTPPLILLCSIGLVVEFLLSVPEVQGSNLPSYTLFLIKTKISDLLRVGTNVWSFFLWFHRNE